MSTQKSLSPTHHRLIPAETIERRMQLIRGDKMMLDADSAWLYGVTTKRHPHKCLLF